MTPFTTLRSVAAPLLNMALFGLPRFRAAALVAVVYGAGLFGSTYLLPVFMLVALKLSASSVGAVLLPAGLALALTIPVAGKLSDHRPLAQTIVIGLSVMCASFAAVLAVGEHTAVLWVTLIAVLGRIGLGLVIPSLSLASVRALPAPLMPYGTSTMNFLRQLGGRRRQFAQTAQHQEDMQGQRFETAFERLAGHLRRSHPLENRTVIETKRVGEAIVGVVV